MPHTAIYKSLTADFLDDLFSGDETSLEQAYETAEQLLHDHADDSLSATTAELISDNILSPDVGTTDEFDDFWLKSTSQLAGKEVDRVMRHGYAEALRIGREEYPALVPIETFWVTGAGDDFEIHICKGKRRVTVFMFIPKARRYGSTRSESASWIVRVGGLRDDQAVALHEGTPPIVKLKVSGAEPAQS